MAEPIAIDKSVQSNAGTQAIPLRFVTAASLFDGHDASINIMRRMLQAAGVEVIHLGHNRSVAEIVDAAVQEDADAIAVSSYQGGHVEFFGYMLSMLEQRGASDVRVFGGGGGVIVDAEIEALHAAGVERIYSPEDGHRLGLRGMINDMISRCRPLERNDFDLGRVSAGNERALSTLISGLTNGTELAGRLAEEVCTRAKQVSHAPVIGITGTGGAGKSSLTDELIRRFRLDQADRLRIAVIAVDPSRRKSGGALLGDRIRMNAIDHPNIFMRSLATRASGAEIPECLPAVIAAVQLGGFDVIVVETSGIGQGDAAIAPLVNVSLYVMTPEYGAQSQLEKIDMLDFADLVAINKFERRGSEDALRDVRKQWQRNNEQFGADPESLPVFGTIAARFNDDGVSALYAGLVAELGKRALIDWTLGALERPSSRTSSDTRQMIPGKRQRYLSEISECVRDYHVLTASQAQVARERQQLRESARMLGELGRSVADVNDLADQRDGQLLERSRQLLEYWPEVKARYQQQQLVSKVRDREITTPLRFDTLSGTSVPRISLPQFSDDGDLLSWLMRENLPGFFPFTAGVFPLKRDNEDPSRMFAGEGDAFKTNQRFKFLSSNHEAKRLSTAFDSVTLYGFDPHEQPDIYGKVGNSGVSIATLDDMKVLYDGFDLLAPNTSVSMTINGPAPTILAMFLNTAIDQAVASFEAEQGRSPDTQEYAGLRARALKVVRGTVQADILKEDQGQNTCIFSAEFSLKVMGDIAEWFIDHEVRNFYSASISGYHIAEAGANPITQLAFTLANGFTYVESYLARGMPIDGFAPGLSFFFSNGMDPEYTVLGRVARRIWATAMRDRYGASERSQKLKYHIQTSGRSLHAQEMSFNDIRTTLQALIATYDHCNSLHTNAYDEAITTPTEESVRRALAIQMVINKEWGLAANENPNQGSFVIDELTDLVEEAVLVEFDRLSERGGVLGAMETGYQRGKIQDESLYYEHRKHDGSLPIVGVNTFLSDEAEQPSMEPDLSRSSVAEKQGQLARLEEFKQRHEHESAAMLQRIRDAVSKDENVFAVLMDAVRCCSLGQITDALFEVGGKYRRSM
ncbi:MAG: methylmalonyl-CoA mutase [Thiotrichales bacterium]|nr:methylmalonyl-CoA mutase [Thiotrichales bacterium]